MSVLKKFGIQSWCFREFKDNREVIRLLKECGVSQVELCGIHADFSKPETFPDIIRIYRDAGIEIVSIGVQGFSGNEKAESLFFQFAKQAGARFISATFSPSSLPASFRVAEKLAEENDIRLGIHNHGGRHWLGCAEMLQQVFDTTHDRIGLCLDTAWAMDSGEDPVAMVEKFGTRLYGLHLKDFTFNRARHPHDEVLGTGNLKVKELLQALNKVKFNGFAVIEYERDEKNPVPALKKCVEVIRKETHV